jgi:hypothetical protein
LEVNPRAFLATDFSTTNASTAQRFAVCLFLIIKSHNGFDEVIQRNKQDACGECEKETARDFF